MADEPSPPPRDDNDEGDRDDQELYPFMDVVAMGGPAVEVRAGWADSDSSDVVASVVNYGGSAGSPAAERAFEAALEWYRDTVSALVREGVEEQE